MIVAWLFLGLGAAIFHYGPGQDQVEMDRIASVLDGARTNAEAGDYTNAVYGFEEVLVSLPIRKSHSVTSDPVGESQSSNVGGSTAGVS